MNIIIESAKDVYDNLNGLGLTEAAYQKALFVNLKTKFNIIEVEKLVPITYMNHQISTGRADIVIDNKIIIELKNTSKLATKDELQIKKYMKFLNIDKGILINFGNFEYKIIN